MTEVSNDTLFEACVDSDLVRIKDAGLPGIVSANFTRRAFWKQKWDSTTVKARGLFFNESNGEIVARGYDKFFNLGETNGYQSFEDMVNAGNGSLMTCSLKYNGFLTIVSVIGGELVFFSKSGVTTFSKVAETIFYQKFNSEQASILKEFLGNNGCSATFECLSILDPHICRIEEDNIVLLDVIRNEEDFVALEKSEYENILGFLMGEEDTIVSEHLSMDDEEIFNNIIGRVNDRRLEGVVVRFGKNRNLMSKVKTDWYVGVKDFRSVITSRKSRQPRTAYGRELLEKLNSNEIDINEFAVNNILGNRSFDMFSLVSVIENI